MVEESQTCDRILFFLGSAGFLSGVFLTNIFTENTLFIFALVCILSVQILLFLPRALFFVLVFITLFCIGGYVSIERTYEIRAVNGLLEKETGFFTQERLIQGVLTEKVSEDNQHARYILRKVSIGIYRLPETVGILVSFPESQGKTLDDVVTFTGALRAPTVMQNFDYRTYLLLKDVYTTVSVASSQKIGKAPSPGYVTVARHIRDRLIGIIENLYPKESAKLLEGILIGERADLSLETKKAFNNSGLTHIVAVSGFNITVILVFLSFLFRPFPGPVKFALAFVCVGFFILLVGLQVPVLRAGVFGLVAYAAFLAKRRVRGFSVLVAVAMVFVFLDPLVLTDDISFHLSFLAVFWLLFFGDFFNRMLSFLPRWFGLRESLALCLAAMIFTLPVVMLNFWQVSLVAPLANMAVVPLVPLIMLGGFVSMVVGWFSLPMGIFAGFPVWLWLRYILRCVAWFGELPYASVFVDLGTYRHVFVVMYFMTAVFWVLYFRKEEV